MLNPYLEKKSPAFLFPSEFFKKVWRKKNEQTKVYDHGGQATRGQKIIHLESRHHERKNYYFFFVKIASSFF